MSTLETGTGKDAFREAYAEAERKAAASAGLTDEQPRDDAGRFVAENPPTDITSPDGEPADAPAPEQAVPVETPDERDARIARLEAQLAEKEAFIGRQSNEVGELRAAFEQQLSAINDRLNTPTPRHITPDLIEQNPAAATQLAYEQGDTQTLAIAYEQWALEAPAAAATWVSEQRANEREQKLRAEFDERQKQLEERFAPLQQDNENAQLQSGFQALPEETRAFLTDRESVQALANEFPTIGKTIAQGSPTEKLEAIKALYDIHRGRTADTLTKTVQDVAHATAQEAQTVRDEAYVASSTASQEEPLTYEQQEQQRMKDIFAAKSAPGFGGALVRPSK